MATPVCNNEYRPPPRYGYSQAWFVVTRDGEQLREPTEEKLRLAQSHSDANDHNRRICVDMRVLQDVFKKKELNYIMWEAVHAT